MSRLLGELLGELLLTGAMLYRAQAIRLGELANFALDFMCFCRSEALHDRCE